MLAKMIGGIQKKQTMQMTKQKSDKNKTINIGFDRLYLFASLSRLAYRSFQDVKNTSIALSADEPHLINLLSKSTRPSKNDFLIFEKNENLILGYAWRSQNMAYVVFKGSETKYEFIDNFDITQIPLFDENECPQIRSICAHRGYIRQYRFMEPGLLSFLNQSNIHEVYFLGHSRGGAIAHIAALAFHVNNNLQKKQNKKKTHCITFGAPRAGNSAFAAFYETQTELLVRTCRIYHIQDIVSYLPLSSKYKHISSPTICLYEKYEKSFKENTCLNFLKIIRAHNIITYMRLLQQLYSKSNHKV